MLPCHSKTLFPAVFKLQVVDTLSISHLLCTVDNEKVTFNQC